ncbi:hypothetical protein AB0L63_07105 [Nocardia sp. NPDC051990]|uniref:hypothetical protein n=1 Tax=Nocardia sp. NPDC051990 TaxID=3155285 RepID=UPI00342C8255
MAEIEEVRQWLDRAAEFLRGQLHWFGGQIAPGAVPHVAIPAHPSRVDNTDPGRYRFEAVANLTWRDDPTAVHRAAHVLRTTGWTVDMHRDPDFPTVVTVVGIKDGYRMQARTEEGYGGIVLLGETPDVVLYEDDPLPTPPPAVTPETLSPGALLCYECDGLGHCPVCKGRGWTKGGSTGRIRCRECLGSKVCPVCGGAGEVAVTDLTEEARAHYPDLG